MHTLCLWHDMYYIWCHPYCVYDHTGSISDMKLFKTAISSTLYVITPSMSKTSPLLCKNSQGISIPSYAFYMTSYPHFMTAAITNYDMTCSIFITSHALYMTSHVLCVMSRSLWVLHHTMTLSVIINTLCLWHIHLYGNTHSVMKTQPLCAFTATMTDIIFSVFQTLHKMY